MYLGVNVSPKELAQRAESLVRHSSNRYLTTVRIAFRAKQRRFDDFDGLLEDSMVKPVQRAIIEEAPRAFDPCDQNLDSARRRGLAVGLGWRPPTLFRVDRWRGLGRGAHRR
ncbi:MAG: hypothetical protein RLZZ168_817 [Cyanobacteriota bacterium]